ncbi:hypothetical protein BVX95_00190 [archaeon D22]|nr:hypothetical protein BVX95_00190 [archaeon D22]
MYEELLNEWNPWWSSKYSHTSVKREYFEKLINLLDLKHIIALLGVRRSGKTDTLFQIVDHLLKKVKSDNILFIKVDDLRIKENLDFRKIDSLIEEYKKINDPKGKIYLLLDEIQELPNWQQYLKTLYDLNINLKIIVTGSNAQMLKKDISTYLTGRIIEQTVYPFSFNEFLTAKQIGKEFNPANIIKIKKSFDDYLVDGGFPETITSSSKKIIQKEYFQTILFKDVVSRYNISNSQKILDFALYILSNSTKLFNFSSLAKQFSYSSDSVSDYISYFEEVFFIFRMFVHDYSLKKQLINPKKLYCIDNGIITASSFKFSKDSGRLMENLVFVELKRKDYELYYYKDKNECDFLVKHNAEIIDAIQVTEELNSSNKDREINGLLGAMKTHSLNEGTILTYDHEENMVIDDKKIHIVPLWKWLMKQ